MLMGRSWILTRSLKVMMVLRTDVSKLGRYDGKDVRKVEEGLTDLVK
jgi:hypothetical protein